MTAVLLAGLATSMGGAYALRVARTKRAEEVAAFFMLLPLALLCAYVFVSGGN